MAENTNKVMARGLLLTLESTRAPKTASTALCWQSPKAKSTSLSPLEPAALSGFVLQSEFDTVLSNETLGDSRLNAFVKKLFSVVFAKTWQIGGWGRDCGSSEVMFEGSRSLPVPSGEGTPRSFHPGPCPLANTSSFSLPNFRLLEFYL